ncbi:cytochrome P450 [Streptomyces sp. 2333.5]|uniref:cytochrome P450 n=1 Tax=unclassified Streptomyces TaxID=2593676 RepID=UPI00089977F8|nr:MULTISPECIES: cytochrome P450 [unclassified Streptomyces]PJI99954.1 cytochrome P450 [Streptomyces sp. 2333.5]SEC51799.1 Cytochrome P450 [Streptomyces sp. 2112.2]
MTRPAAGAGEPQLPDVFDPRGYVDGLPHTAYQFLRDWHPVAWQEEHEVLGWPAGPGFWAVTRHADVVRVLKDARTFSSCLGATQIRDPDPADLPFIRRMMLNQDPPDHGRLRRAVSRAFTPGRIDRFATVVRQRARDLLTAAVDTARGEDGVCDLVGAVTDDFALLNLADLLGVPPGERGLLLDWTRRVIGYQDPDEAAPAETGPDGRPADPRSPAMLQDMFAFARELAAHKRRHPGDDVMTTLASDAELAVPELEMFFFLLTIAGNDTVRSAAPGGLLALARHPEAYRALRTGVVGMPAAVEELLRWHPPVLSFRRTAAYDTELAGRSVRAGDKVVVFHGAANYDERVFAAPHRLDLTRSPNPHVSFGDGPHVCLGAHLARLQLRVLYEETCRLLPALEVAAPPRRLVSNFIHGLKSLPLRLVDVASATGPP